MPSTALPSRLTVFISYSRKETDIAERVRDALRARDIDVLMDQHDLPYGEPWRQQLEDMIRDADTVIWLVSEASIRSEDCLWEVDRRKQLNKRLVPVKIGELPAEALPALIGDRQMMFLMPEHDFDLRLDELADTLKIPLKWVKLHTQLARQARRQVRLRGQEVKEAMDWLDAMPDCAEPPTEAIMDLIANSRRTAILWKSFMIGGLLLLMSAVFAATLYNGVQRRATQEVQRAQSAALAVISEWITDDGNAASGMLLALEALPDPDLGKHRPMVENAQRGLSLALYSLRERAVLDAHEGAVTYAESSEDGSLVLTASHRWPCRLVDDRGSTFSTN